MKPQDLRGLVERASTVEGRVDVRLDEVHARIRTARRRRQFAAVSAAVFAVVLALTTGVGLLALTDTDRTPPAEPAPRPTAKPGVPEDKAPSVRRLTYAAGDKVHLGDQTIDAGRQVDYIDATDDGAVFVTSPSRGAGPNSIWFTDGSDPVLIGHASGRGWGYDVVTSTTGPYVVWWQTDKQVSSNSNDPGEHVVYDTAKQQVAARFGGSRGSVRGVHEDYVYWIPDDRAWCLDFDRYRGECRRYKGIMRLEVSTGRQEQVSWASYREDARSEARTLVRSGSKGAPDVVDPYFWRVGTRLVPIGGRPPAVRGWDYRDDLAPVADVRTGKPLRLRVPSGYSRAEAFQLVQWLDADRVAMFAYCCGAGSAEYLGYPSGGSEMADEGDIFVCTLSKGTCKLAVKGSDSTGYQVPMAD